MICPLVDVERGDLQHFVGCAIPDVADQQAMVRIKGPARIAVAAKNDIYTAGPLDVAIRISAVQ